MSARLLQRLKLVNLMNRLGPLLGIGFALAACVRHENQSRSFDDLHPDSSLTKLLAPRLAAYEPAPLVAPAHVPASQLKAGLQVNQQRIGANAAALFKIALDPRADYLSYEACALTGDKACVRDIVCASYDLMPDGHEPLLEHLVFDLPPGASRISYQACAFPDLVAAGESACGAKEHVYFEQGTRPDVVLQRLVVEEGELSSQIKGQASSVLAALKTFLAKVAHLPEPSSAAKVSRLAHNQLLYNPCKLGGIYESEHYEDIKEFVLARKKEELAAEKERLHTPGVIVASTLLFLGASGLVGSLFGVYAHRTPSINPAGVAAREKAKGMHTKSYSSQVEEAIATHRLQRELQRAQQGYTTLSFFGIGAKKVDPAPAAAAKLQQALQKRAQNAVDFADLRKQILGQARQHFTFETYTKTVLISAGAIVLGGILMSAFALAEASPITELSNQLGEIGQRLEELRTQRTGQRRRIAAYLESQSPSH